MNDPLWNSEDAPDPNDSLAALGWLLVILRGIAAWRFLVFGGLIILAGSVRLIERPLFGVRRPVTPFITQFVCRNAFRILGIGFRTSGELMQNTAPWWPTTPPGWISSR